MRTMRIFACSLAALAVVGMLAGVALADLGRWDWTFSQGSQLERRKLDDDALVGEGICYAMSYNWVKRGLKKKEVSKELYESKEKFERLAEQFRDYMRDDEHDDADGFWVDRGTSEGLKLEEVADEEFKRSHKKLIKKVDGLKTGFYLLGMTNDDGGHEMAFEITTKKKAGRFFDPNLGQFTVTKKNSESPGEMIARVLDALYEDEYTKDGSFDIYRVTVADKKKFKKAEVK